MHGNFKNIHVRMIPTAKTGESFVKVAANQPEHSKTMLTNYSNFDKNQSYKYFLLSSFNAS